GLRPARSHQLLRPPPSSPHGRGAALRAQGRPHGLTTAGPGRKGVMRKLMIFLCVVLALALATGACGGGKKKKKATTTTTESTTTTSTGPLVTTKTDAKLGTILADDKGMTLYTLTSAGAAVTCDATCTAVWPPLELPSGVLTPTSTPDVTGLGTTAGRTGTTIVTHDGLPLYRFSRDQTPADALGEGIQRFGGVWHVGK